MKKMTRALLALLTVVALLATVPAVLAAGPADHGWGTDGDDFTGWVTTDGVNFTCDYANKPSSKNDFRIWKDFIEDANNFDLSLDVIGSATTDLYVKLMGVRIEFACNNGNGNQFIIKLNGDTQRPGGNDWQNATGCKASVKLVRESGGDIKITITPAGGSAINLSAAPTEADNENLEVGLYRGGSAKFENFAANTTGGQGGNGGGQGGNGGGQGGTTTPAEFFGWDTDGKDFAGWTSTDGKVITASRDTTHGSHRIWKDLITDPQNFSISLKVTNDNTSSAYIKIYGLILELNSRDGNGNQTFLKFDEQNQDWFNCNGCAVDITISRTNGGDITFTLTGAGNDTPKVLTKAVKEDNENLEIGIYAGNIKIENVKDNSNSGTITPPSPTGDGEVMIVGALLAISVLAMAAVVTFRKSIA